VRARWIAWGDWVAREWPYVLALCVFVLALWAQADAMVGVFYDDGIYVVLAKALATGEGYRNIHLPGAPAAVHYPVLYPLALSLLWRLWPAFPANVVLFEIFDAAALAVAAWLMALHARRANLPLTAAPLALLLGFTAFPLLAVVGVRLSEPLFLALFAGAVLLADGDVVTDRKAVGAGVLAGLATLARSVGVAVVAGVAVGLWIKGRRRAAVIHAAVAAVMVVPWFGWAMGAKGGIDPRLAASYGTYFDELGQAGVSGVLPGFDLSVLGPLARLTLPGVPGWLWYPLAALLAVVIGWGGVILARRLTCLLASVVAYLLIIAFWPFPPDRFLWILVPWMALLGAAGGIALWRRGIPGRVAVAALVLALAVGYLPRQVTSLKNRGFARTAERISTPFGVLVPAISAETPGAAVVASADEPLIYLYTGRRAVPNHIFRWKERDTEAFSADTTYQFFCDYGVSYLALTSPTANAAPLSMGLEPMFRVSGGPALFRYLCPA
jgi:hypothetical protein